MRRLIVLLALALGACGGPDTNPDARAVAPDVASNFSQPLDGRGIDPAWGLKIRGLQLTLDRPDRPDLVGTAPGMTVQAHTATWNATLPSGQVMKVSLYASPCSDLASGSTYPFSAEVLLPGTSPLAGCAGPPAARRR